MEMCSCGIQGITRCRFRELGVLRKRRKLIVHPSFGSSPSLGRETGCSPILLFSSSFPRSFPCWRSFHLSALWEFQGSFPALCMLLFSDLLRWPPSRISFFFWREWGGGLVFLSSVGSVSSSFLFLGTQPLVKQQSPEQKVQSFATVFRTTSEVVLQFVLLYPSDPRGKFK